MKLRILLLLFLVHIFLGCAFADDNLYLYIECSPGQSCINFTFVDGNTVSVLATPAQILGKTDIKSASIVDLSNLNIELTKEATAKLEKITGENIGKKLMVVLFNKIIIQGTIHAPLTDGRLNCDGKHDPFWEKVPWLQELINQSVSESGRSVRIYSAIAVVFSISAFAFILLPRVRRKHQPDQE